METIFQFFWKTVNELTDQLATTDEIFVEAITAILYRVKYVKPRYTVKVHDAFSHEVGFQYIIGNIKVLMFA